MICKPSLAFTALALVGIIKQGKTRYLVSRDSLSPWLSVLTYPKWLVILFCMKPLAMSGPNAEKCHFHTQSGM